MILPKGGNKDTTQFPKGIQCHKCRGWGHLIYEFHNRLNVIIQGGELYLGEGMDQEKGCEEETKEGDRFQDDDDGEQEPNDEKGINIPKCLVRKVLIEKAWPQEGEYTMPIHVAYEKIL